MLANPTGTATTVNCDDAERSPDRRNVNQADKIGFDTSRPLLDTALSADLENGAADPILLGQLADSYRKQFERFGRLDDIEMAIKYHTTAVSVTSNGHPERLILMSDLANCYLLRFQRVEQLEDLQRAIEYQVQVSSLTADEDPVKLAVLSNLGTSYLTRFERLGQPADLDAAISRQSEALSLTPDGDLAKPGILGNLGNSHQYRFRLLGELSDAQIAIDCQACALSLTPNEHPRRPGMLNNLGGAYHNLFLGLGQPADLDMAIEYQTQAVSRTSDDHPDKSGWLSNLGQSHFTRFNHLGQLPDLDIAISCLSEAVSLTPNGHPAMPGILNTLGGLYHSRFQRLGRVTDLDIAIECHTQAIPLTTDGNPDRFGRLSNLGLSYYSRFERLDQLTDLDLAIKYQGEAVSLIPTGHADRPVIIYNLGGSYFRRFESLKQLTDLDIAISCNGEAVSLTPQGHPNWSGRLGSLGVLYQHRFDSYEQLEDLERAIGFQSQAASFTPDEHPGKPERLVSLGNSLTTRFHCLGQLVDLDMAIEYQSQAVSLAPDGHPGRPEYLTSLGHSHGSRFQHLGEHSDMNNAIAAFKQAAQSSTGHPFTRFKASCRWARLCLSQDVPSSLEAYQQAISLIQQVVWLGNATDQRLSDTSSVYDVAVEAAAVAITLQRYNLALELLEAGRSIVWKQLLQLRTPFEELSVVDASVAEQLKQVARDLYSVASMNHADGNTALTAVSPERTAQQRRRLAEQWEQLVDQARQLPGMSHFSRPKAASELISAARTGPVILVSAHRAYCGALVVSPSGGDVNSITLPNFTYEKVALASTHLAHSLRKQGLHQRGFTNRHTNAQDQLETMLAMLWTDVAKPILDFLGYTQAVPDSELPHITWCTSGPLSFLPLHAAGDYSKPNSSLFDYAISSYTPTLSALLSPPPDLQAFSGVLAIGQTATPGLSVLPGTVSELDRVREYTGNVRFTRLEGELATSSAVLANMEQHSWVHFACHASQNSAEPTRSAFHLHDGALDLVAITREPLRHAQLAFLSACQTATGDKELPEEAVHLAAGMLMAGYPTVIATMWSIRDQDAPVVAQKFYECVVTGGFPDARRAARALHTAVGHLREKVGVKKFERWAPYIHIGQ